MSPRRGSILIAVLFVMVVLSLLTLSFAYRAGLRARSARDRAVHRRLRAEAASAASVALAALRSDANEFDHPAEAWHSHRPFWDEAWLRDGGGGGSAAPEFVTDYHVIDEEGKLHVSRASGEALGGMGMTKQQIAALFDWTDGDEDAPGEGAETQFYAAQPSPYRSKNAAPELLDELLMVRGFGRADFNGEDANHNGLLDSAEDDGVESPPADDGDGRLRLGWVDLLTCAGDGRMNINTAPREVLETLPLSDGAVGQIVSFRAFDGDSASGLEEHAFRSPADIDQLQGLSDADKEVLKGVAVFKSQHFRVFAHSTHRPTGQRYAVEVFVSKGEGGLEILQWKAGS